MARMRTLGIAGLITGGIFAALVTGSVTALPAHAALSIVAGIGGAPTGVSRNNLDGLAVGSVSPQLIAPGVTLSLVPDAAVVQGSASGLYAAPYLSGSNGAGFGSPNQPNGADTTPYLTTGSTGSFAGAGITISFTAPQQYFGLLWGSVDSYNTLSFYDGATLVGALTGSQVTASATGDQGINGTFYVNINSDLAFDRVVATSSQYAFEFDNIAWNDRPVGVPEPTTLGLLATGLLGLGLCGRRLARRRRG